MDKISLLDSAYSSTSSFSESQLSTTLPSPENQPSCKSHPISTIQYSQDGELKSQNVDETCLDSKVLSHVLSNDEWLEALNANLENLKISLEKVPNNVSDVSIRAREVTLDNEKLNEMYRITNKYCQEQFKREDHELDDERFSFADFKFRKFLEGSGNKVSVFFSNGKISIVGHDTDIACFKEGILISVLHDGVITESMNLDDEQFLYLKTTHLQMNRKYTVNLNLEDKICSEKMESCTATFNGLKEDVVNVLREVRRRLERYKKHFWSKQLNSNECLLLQEKRVINHLRGELSRRDCSYLIVKDMLHVASETQEVDSFKSYLENALFIEIKRKLCDLEKKLFLSDEWVNMKYTILRNNAKRQVVVSVTGNELVATCLPRIKDQVEIFIEDFLKAKIQVKIFEWKCAVDTKQMCLSVKKEEIMSMLESRKESMMSISVEEDGVHLQGLDIGIQACQEMLKSTVADKNFHRATFTTASGAVMQQLSTPSAKQKLQEVGKRTRSVINVRSNCKIGIKIGNLADEEVDVIVNSVDTNTNSYVGASTVAGAIFEKGGHGFRDKLVRKTNGRMEYGDVVVTKADGHLRCKAVYHACLNERPSNQEEEVRKMVKMCLEKAVRDGYTSLSFPALGTGVYDYSGVASAKGLFDAIIEFLDICLVIEKINIVLFEGARRPVIESYQREHGNRCNQESTSAALTTLTKGCITAGNVTVVAENQQNIDNARKELENLIRTLSTEDQQ